MEQSYVRVLGSADWLQSRRNDHSCYTVNDRILVDACSNVVQNLLEQDVDPVSVSTLCFTHMHADHYMGLAPLLLYWRVRKGSFGEMTIVGPKATVRAGFERALNFVFHDSRDLRAEVREMPAIVEIDRAGRHELPGWDIEAIASDHAVPGLCYRITDHATGHCVGFSGDTLYRPEFGPFFKDVDMLVHEVSFGTTPCTEENNGRCRHSSSYDAARVCRESGAKRLLCTHTTLAKRESALALARSLVDVPTEWAMPYNTFPF